MVSSFISQLFPPFYPERTSTYNFGPVGRFLAMDSERLGNGLKLPHCQRELCWTQQQYEDYIRFILHSPESCGEFIIVLVRDTATYYLVDGQHRKHAIEMFLNGEIVIDGVDIDTIGMGMLEKREEKTRKTIRDLGRHDLDMHLMGTMREIVIPTYDAELIERIYNSHNFTGVKH